MIRVAVHIGDETPGHSFAHKWVDAIEKQGAEPLVLDFREVGALNQIGACQGAMWHWRHTPDDKQAAPEILCAIELGFGIPVFPSIRSAWHFDEKRAQHYLLQSAGVPAVKSWVFWNLEESLAFTAKCSYPLVFKLSVGAGAANVLKVESRSQADTLVRRMFTRGATPYSFNEHGSAWTPFALQSLHRLKSRIVQRVKHAVWHNCPLRPHYYLTQKNYAYFQEFLPGNDHDVRVTVVGDRAWGYIRHNRKGDFRASGSGLLDYDPANIPVEAVEIAHKVSRKCGFQSMAYDFLRGTDGRLLVNEVSYCYVDEFIYRCPGYWGPAMNWHEGHFWPEDAHVEDLLAVIEDRNGTGRS